MAQSKTNIESIRGMTYEEYVEGKKSDKTLQFQFDPIFTNEKVFLKGFGKVLFYACLMGYMIAPIIIVPLISYKYDNWYLLFGILFSYFSTFLAMRKQQWQWAAPLLFMFWYWYKNGFHIDDYENFFWLCLLWGGWTYSLAIGYEDEFAKIEVLKNPELFNKLSKNGTIYFLHKTEIEAKEKNYELLSTDLIQTDFENTINNYINKIEVEPYVKRDYYESFTKYKTESCVAAAKALDKLIEFNPKISTAYILRGLYFYKNGDLNQAKSDWKKAGDLGITKGYDLIKNLLG